MAGGGGGGAPAVPEVIASKGARVRAVQVLPLLSVRRHERPIGPSEEFATTEGPLRCHLENAPQWQPRVKCPCPMLYNAPPPFIIAGDCVGGWVTGWMDEWVSGWVGGWVTVTHPSSCSPTYPSFCPAIRPHTHRSIKSSIHTQPPINPATHPPIYPMIVRWGDWVDGWMG